MAVVTVPRHGRTPHRSEFVLVAILAVLVLAAVGLVLLAPHVTSVPPSQAVQGSGLAATQTRDLARFSGVELSGNNNVTISVGGRQSVIVHADTNLLRQVTTKVTAGELVIGDVGSFTARSPMYVDVTVPSLTALNLTGSGLINVTGIRAAHLTVSLPGSGDLTASGSAGQLSVTLGGSGRAQLSGLTAQDVQAVVSGSGEIEVTAVRSLHAEVPGTGAVLYGGNPQVTASVTGSGVVTPG